MHLTWFGSNSWLIEMANQRILLDPWLVGPLVFGNQEWFFKAEQGQSYEIPENVDLILLSQGLPDHAHPPTLEALDKQIPVWGSPNASKVAKQLGFQTVQAIEHGQSAQQGDLAVHAFPGSQIGPMLTENAYIVKDAAQSESLYYEPHGFHHESLQALDSVDAAIVPLIDLTVPFAGAFIKGGDVALELAQWLKPQVVVPTTVGGNVKYSGILNSLLGSKGDLASLRMKFLQAKSTATILEPFLPGARVQVPLKQMQPA